LMIMAVLFLSPWTSTAIYTNNDSLHFFIQFSIMYIIKHMDKKVLIIFLIIFLGLSAAITNAYTSKPANGHSWSEMECTGGLCVTADNKVGIGTDIPTEKLEVDGDILVSGDACISTGYCLSDLDVFE